MTDSNSDLLSSAAARQAAGGVSLCTLWRWEKAGTIPKPRKVNNRNYWVRGELLAALAKASGGSGHE